MDIPHSKANEHNSLAPKEQKETSYNLQKDDDIRRYSSSSDSKFSCDSSEDEEKENSLSDSSSDCSIISPTDTSSSSSSERSSPVTCIPWESETCRIVHDPKCDLKAMDPEKDTQSPRTSYYLERKRKERHESYSQNHDSKIRASERTTEGREDSNSTTITATSGSDSHVDENVCQKFKPLDTKMYDGSSEGFVPAISLTKSGNNNIPIMSHSDAESQRQWERTAAQWQTRKLRRNYHQAKHVGRSSKSFSDAEDVFRSNSSNFEELSISKHRRSFAGISIYPQMNEPNQDSTDVEMSTSKDVCSNLSVDTSTPPLDFSTLHHQMESEEPISYVTVQSRSSSDHVMLSPRNSVTVSEIIESCPPTPPVYQLPLDPPNRQPIVGSKDSKIDALTRQISCWKTHLKALEKEHIALVGYKPSHADKSNNKEMKKVMQQISRAKHELKQLREEPINMEKPELQIGEKLSSDNKKLLEATVTEVEAYLLEDRLKQNRPNEILLMSSGELMIEKETIHKQLLLLEKLHGRPSSREQKDIVRPLYDRYRMVKKLSTRIFNVKENSLDLVPIKEHETLNFEKGPESTLKTPVKEIKKSPKEYRRHFRPLTSSGTEEEDFEPSFGNEAFKDMNLGELEYHYQKTSDEKKRLRVMLRALEGSSPSVSSKYQGRDEKITNLETEFVYQKYKHARATLRLLDVLINKQKYPK